MFISEKNTCTLITDSASMFLHLIHSPILWKQKYISIHIDNASRNAWKEKKSVVTYDASSSLWLKRKMSTNEHHTVFKQKGTLRIFPENSPDGEKLTRYLKIKFTEHILIISKCWIRILSMVWFKIIVFKHRKCQRH